MIVPTVDLKKDGTTIRVNEADAALWVANGWTPAEALPAPVPEPVHTPTTPAKKKK